MAYFGLLVSTERLYAMLQEARAWVYRSDVTPAIRGYYTEQIKQIEAALRERGLDPEDTYAQQQHA